MSCRYGAGPVPVCAGPVPVCAGLCRSCAGPVPVCAGLCRSVPVCAGLCRSCAGLCRSVPVGASLCRSVPVGADAAERPQETLYLCEKTMASISFNFNFFQSRSFNLYCVLTSKSVKKSPDVLSKPKYG
jgi:hypothetical protein